MTVAQTQNQAQLDNHSQNSLLDYLQDPFLNRLYSDLKKAPPIKSISLDITNVCNLRCTGCYFFAEDRDKNEQIKDEVEVDAFIEREKARGTNYITVVGGEPALVLNRLEKLYKNFKLVVATNGTIKIPYEGFENLSLILAIWGDRETDKKLRGGGKIDILSKSFANYKDDPRVAWYYTTTPGNAHEIEDIVKQCIDNGNRVLFNFYGDTSGIGGDYDHTKGFEQVHREINRMISLYPDKILLTSYMSKVFSTRQLYGEDWSYAVCSNLSVDYEPNKKRFTNGKAYNTHFLAYNSDLKTIRRCGIGETQDCSTCHNSWVQMSWLILAMERHLGSKQEFTNWLTSIYMFYMLCRFVDFQEGIKLLPEIHKRVGLVA